jgi:DnaJ-domain-containing protein 1
MYRLFKNFKSVDMGFYTNTYKSFFKKTNFLLKKDYYSKVISYIEILGVNKNSDANEIKKAYFKLAKEWHPDVNKSTGAKEKFSEISE